MEAASGQRPRSGEPIRLSQPSDRENAASRRFRAPIDHVFRVFTEPAFAPAIWAPNPADAEIEAMEVRPGGRYSIRVKQPDGSTVRFFGEYIEVVPPQRIVNSFEVSALPGARSIETDEFVSEGEYTRLSVRWKFDSREDRDRMYGPDLESALTTAWTAVDHLLETMR